MQIPTNFTLSLAGIYLAIWKIEFSSQKQQPQSPHIQKVIWIANKHLHNYNLQNNPQYQVMMVMMVMVMMVMVMMVMLSG